MNNILLFIILFIVSTSIYSEVDKLKARLIPIDASKNSFSEGDVFLAKVQLWPYTSHFLKNPKGLKNINIDGRLLLLNVIRVKYSENNSDLLEIIGRFVFLKFSQQNNLLFNVDGLSLKLDIKKFNFTVTPGRTKEPIVLSQKLRTDSFNYKKTIYIFFFIFFIGTIIQFLIYLRRKRLVLDRKKIEYQIFIDRLSSSQNREDFEKLFIDRENWKNHISSSEAYLNFVNAMNNVQFKKVWTSDEKQKVSEITLVLKEHLWEERKDV